MSQSIPLHWAKGDRALISVEVVRIRRGNIADPRTWVDIKVEGIGGVVTIPVSSLKLPIEGRCPR